jgi:hypothetical protein
MIKKWFPTLSAMGLAGAMAFGADLDRPAAGPPGAPPVLKPSEPMDTGFVTLPGLPAPPPRVLKPLGEIPPMPAVPDPVLPDAPETALPKIAVESPLPAPRRLLKPMPALPEASSVPAANTPVLPDAPPVALPKLAAKTTSLDAAPALRRAPKPWLPPDFEKDSAASPRF